MFGPPCPEDAVRQADGLCYANGPTVGPTADEVIAALPACVLDEANGRLDLDAHCVDRGCAGDSIAEMSLAVGEEGDCNGWGTAYSGTVRAHCRWSAGFAAYFPVLPDPEEEGAWLPDRDASTLSPIAVLATYTGTTDEGLGVGSPISCWIDALGLPYLAFEWKGGEPIVQYAIWDDQGVFIVGSDDRRVLWLEPR